MKEHNLVAHATTLTSLQIAETTGKRHSDVLRAIRSMEPAWEKVNGRKFASVEYVDEKGEHRPCFSLTKTECLYIATKFNDVARARLILRWEELEKAQSCNSPAVLMLGKALANAQAEINALRSDICDQATAMRLILNGKVSDNSIHGKLDFIIGCLGEMMKFYRPTPPSTSDITPDRLREILSDLQRMEEGGAK